MYNTLVKTTLYRVNFSLIPYPHPTVRVPFSDDVRLCDQQTERETLDCAPSKGEMGAGVVRLFSALYASSSSSAAAAVAAAAAVSRTSCRQTTKGTLSRMLVHHRTLASSASEQQPSPSPSPSPSPMYQVPTPSSTAGGAAAAAAGPARSTAQCVLRNIKISPQKLNEVAHIVRRLPVEQAIAQSRVSNKKASRFLETALRSALANATHNHGMDAAKLWVNEVHVGKGQFLKTYAYHARGRIGIMHKKRAHLTVILGEAPESVAAGRGVPHLRIVERPPGWTRQGMPLRVAAAAQDEAAQSDVVSGPG